MKHASLLLACWFLLADAAKIRTAHGTVGTPVVTPKPYAKLPGLGWCVDGQMREGKARSHWGNVDCPFVQNKCDGDPNCVAYACNAEKRIGVIYSNSSNACHGHCDLDHWIEDPTKIMYASWVSPQSLWAQSSCYVVDKPASVVAKFIIDGSDYHTAKKYPAELAALETQLRYGLHSLATIVKPTQVQISLAEPSTFMGTDVSDKHPLIVVAVYYCNASQVQSVVQGIYSDAAETKLSSFIPAGVSGVPKETAKVKIITESSFGGLMITHPSLPMMAEDKLKYSVPGVTSGYIIATTTTTTVDPSRPVTTAAPMVVTPAPVARPVDTIPDEVDAALWDGQSFYYKGGLFCFKIVPGVSIHRMDWKTEGGDPLATDCDADTWKERKDLQIEEVSLGDFKVETYAHKYYDGSDCGDGLKREVTLHMVETTQSGSLSMNYAEPEACKGSLELQFPAQFAQMLESCLVQVPGEFDANIIPRHHSPIQILAAEGSSQSLCIDWQPGESLHGVVWQDVLAKSPNSECDWEVEDVVPVSYYADSLPVVNYGKFGYTRYAQMYNDGGACPAGGKYNAEMHWSKSSNVTDPQVVVTPKGDCGFFMDVKLPSGFEASMRPSPLR
mmetsp:Transcript_41957/g.75353  ORF Transcript_41957/g.75353 Transcript_41957/m.75353 type:complete len:614 (+) Transcript_41957:52-1893(+)